MKSDAAERIGVPRRSKSGMGGVVRENLRWAGPPRPAGYFQFSQAPSLTSPISINLNLSHPISILPRHHPRSAVLLRLQTDFHSSQHYPTDAPLRDTRAEKTLDRMAFAPIFTLPAVWVGMLAESGSRLVGSRCVAVNVLPAIPFLETVK